MAKCYDGHILYEMTQTLETGYENTKRLMVLNKKFEHWKEMHNNYNLTFNK